MNDLSNNQGLSGFFIGLGVLLIVLGALFFVGLAVGFDLGVFEWPFFVIIPGLALSGAGLTVGGPTGERITPLGAAVTMTGVTLLYQNAADYFESWAYTWALVFPTSIGLGKMVYGSLKGRSCALRGWGLLRAGCRHQRVGDRSRSFRLAVGAGDLGDTATGRGVIVLAAVSS